MKVTLTLRKLNDIIEELKKEQESFDEIAIDEMLDRLNTFKKKIENKTFNPSRRE